MLWIMLKIREEFELLEKKERGRVSLDFIKYSPLGSAGNGPKWGFLKTSVSMTICGANQIVGTVPKFN